ncbi:MAG: ABC transporter permease [Phycisphaerales bacterium]|jgi:hypothetical protein|nr:ABC transporter permease [Phycisphaerales bacterium]
MLGIWSIAKHTFAQCVRMKLAAAFVVLLAIALIVLPSQMTGDGTLSGQIRAFLSYGTGISMGLLSMMTILVGASLVSNDIRTKQIFTVAVKPLARSQYLLGRWIGLVAFNFVLLAIACVAIYATAQYMRTKETTPLGRVSISDRRKVETQIFAARRKIEPDPIDLRANVQQRIAQMQKADKYDQAVDQYLAEADNNRPMAAELLRREIEESILDQREDSPESDIFISDIFVARRVAQLQESGAYRTAVEGYLPRTDGNIELAEDMLLKQLRSEIATNRQSIAPGKTMWWDFSKINISGRELRHKAHVVTPINHQGLIRFRMPRSFACRLWRGGPVQIQGYEGRAEAINEENVLLHVRNSGSAHQSISALAAGDTAELIIEPLLQISYKVTMANPDSLSEDKFMGRWQASDGVRPAMGWPRLPEATGQKVPISMSPRLVGDNGRLRFAIHNDSQTSAGVLFRDIALMYDVDSFENNYLRASLLMACQLVYLSAVSVLVGSFVSFPVACMFCVTLIPFSLAREFLTTAAKIPASGNASLIIKMAHYMYIPINALLPDFARTMPGDQLVDGIDISWAFVGETAVADVLIRAGVAMLLAVLLFHRRELARVQV